MNILNMLCFTVRVIYYFNFFTHLVILVFQSRKQGDYSCVIDNVRVC
jgi:hypothetical protein